MGETPDWVHPSAPAASWGSPAQPGSPPPPGSPPSPGQAPWGAWAPPPPDYKPGIVPLRPLSVGEILDGGFATIRKHPRIAFGFAAMFAVLLELARVVTGLLMRNVSGSLSTSFMTTRTGADQATQTHVNSAALASTVVEQVLSGVFGALLAGIVTVVVGKAVLGQRITGSEVNAALRGRAWRLLLVGLIAGLGPFAPSLLVALIAVAAAFSGDAALAITLVIGIPLAIALGMLLWGRLAVAVPAFMLERLSPGAAIGRSWRLVRGAFWRVWGLRALVTLIVGVASSVITLPFVALSGVFGGLSNVLDGNQRPFMGLAVLAVGGAIVWMLTQPLIAAALTLIYVDRRIRAEGLDIQLTQTARAAANSGSGRL